MKKTFHDLLPGRVAVHLNVLRSFIRTGLWAICNADWLSKCKVTGVRLFMPISSRSLTSHVTSDAAADIARYSASEDNLETVPCFFDFQLTGELPRRRRYSVTDFLVSRHAAQSESEKACRVIVPEALRRIP